MPLDYKDILDAVTPDGGSDALAAIGGIAGALGAGGPQAMSAFANKLADANQLSVGRAWDAYQRGQQEAFQQRRDDAAEAHDFARQKQQHEFRLEELKQEHALREGLVTSDTKARLLAAYNSDGGATGETRKALVGMVPAALQAEARKLRGPDLVDFVHTHVGSAALGLVDTGAVVGRQAKIRHDASAAGLDPSLSDEAAAAGLQKLVRGEQVLGELQGRADRFAMQSGAANKQDPTERPSALEDLRPTLTTLQGDIDAFRLRYSDEIGEGSEFGGQLRAGAGTLSQVIGSESTLFRERFQRAEQGAARDHDWQADPRTFSGFERDEEGNLTRFVESGEWNDMRHQLSTNAGVVRLDGVLGVLAAMRDDPDMLAEVGLGGETLAAANDHLAQTEEGASYSALQRIESMRNLRGNGDDAAFEDEAHKFQRLAQVDPEELKLKRKRVISRREASAAADAAFQGLVLPGRQFEDFGWSDEQREEVARLSLRQGADGPEFSPEQFYKQKIVVSSVADSLLSRHFTGPGQELDLKDIRGIALTQLTNQKKRWPGPDGEAFAGSVETALAEQIATLNPETFRMESAEAEEFFEYPRLPLLSEDDPFAARVEETRGRAILAGATQQIGTSALVELGGDTGSIHLKNILDVYSDVPEAQKGVVPGRSNMWDLITPIYRLPPKRVAQLSPMHQAVYRLLHSAPETGVTGFLTNRPSTRIMSQLTSAEGFSVANLVPEPQGDPNDISPNVDTIAESRRRIDAARVSVGSDARHIGRVMDVTPGSGVDLAVIDNAAIEAKVARLDYDTAVLKAMDATRGSTALRNNIFKPLTLPFLSDPDSRETFSPVSGPKQLGERIDTLAPLLLKQDEFGSSMSGFVIDTAEIKKQPTMAGALTALQKILQDIAAPIQAHGQAPIQSTLDQRALQSKLTLQEASAYIEDIFILSRTPGLAEWRSGQGHPEIAAMLGTEFDTLPVSTPDDLVLKAAVLMGAITDTEALRARNAGRN